MKTSELLGIDLLPDNIKYKEKRLPIFGTISVLTPLLFALLYMLLGSCVGSGFAGLGFFLMIGTGGAFVSSSGILFAFVSLVRNEKMFWIFFVGLIFNIPIFLFTANLHAEVFKLFK